MYYSSSRKAASTRKQTSFARTTTTRARFEDGSPSGNETDGGSTELLDISTSREDLSRAPSRCSCHSGESNGAKDDVKDDAAAAQSSRSWSSANLKLEFENNAGSDDEMLKEELLRIFDRERHGLETYFKQKTESILQNYRRKQYEWEETLRTEKIEYENSMAQEKIEVQQNYIGEMTKLTKQFNQEREELEGHYKKQITELTLQFETRKKEMDETIIKERTELKQRLELEYQSMLNTQRTTDEKIFQRQKSDLEEGYKKKIMELEQQLREASSKSESSGRKMQSDLEAKFEKERVVLVAEWRKRVELLEVELGREKERVNKEEWKANESHGFLRNEVSKKEIEIEKLRQSVETLKMEISKKEKTTKEFETLQQNIFVRGSHALPGKLREDFDKMLSAHREELERSFKNEREVLETETEKRTVLERETLEKQSKMERERMALDVEKERGVMKREAREKEDGFREELKMEVDRMRQTHEAEKETLREQVRKELGKEKTEVDEKYLKEKDERDEEAKQQLKRVSAPQEEERKNGLERHEYELWVVNQKMEHTKQWVEGQYRVTEGESGAVEGNRGPAEAQNRKSDALSEEDGRRSDRRGHGEEISNTQVVNHRISTVEEKNATNITINVGSDKNSEYGFRALEQENEGLKTKVAALQENIKLHECYKTEASEEIERLRNTNKEMKTKLAEIKEKMESYEERLEDSEEKVKEYQGICQDYENYIQEYREKISVIEKDRKESTVVRIREDDGRRRSYPGSSRNDQENESGGQKKSDDSGKKFDKGDGGGEDDRRGKSKYKQRESQEDNMVNILQIEKEKLEGVVDDLVSKIRLLEKTISEISLVSSKNDNQADVEKRRELELNLEKVRRQNRDLVEKVKDLQFQLQGLVDKLQKEKNKVKTLQTEYRSFKSMHQSEIKELQEKLQHSGNVIARLQSTSVESSAVGRFQKEITMVGKWMMEERLNDQRMVRARSVEEMENVRSLDREKGELERKLQDVRVALDEYSEHMKNKVSFVSSAGSQFSLNSNGYLRDERFSKTLQALEESQKTSLRQNERLLHEKKELQSLVGRLCKSQEDLGGSKMSFASCGSSTSSSSSSSFVLPARGSALFSNRMSSAFSVFD